MSWTTDPVFVSKAFVEKTNVVKTSLKKINFKVCLLKLSDTYICNLFQRWAPENENNPHFR